MFFPKSNPATAQLAFWGVYAVGFIARPLGAIVFGHIGDSLGRRVTLLISILAITLPTTIIGALPTYAQAGIIAPVLLAILRFVQGVAVGGEFGSAIVYLYEMAPRHRRGLLASLGQVAVSPGIILGIGACLAVLYGCSPGESTCVSRRGTDKRVYRLPSILLMLRAKGLQLEFSVCQRRGPSQQCPANTVNSSAFEISSLPNCDCHVVMAAP